MKLLVYGINFAPELTGIGKYSGEMVAWLVERGHDVHIAAPSYSNKKTGAQQEEHEGQTFTVHRIYSWRWYPHPWLRFALPWRIKQNSAKIIDLVKPDVIHFQSHIVLGRGMTIEGQKRGIRLIGTNHFMPENLMEYTLIIPPFLHK